VTTTSRWTRAKSSRLLARPRRPRECVVPCVCAGRRPACIGAELSSSDWHAHRARRLTPCVVRGRANLTSSDSVSPHHFRISFEYGTLGSSYMLQYSSTRVNTCVYTPSDFSHTVHMSGYEISPPGGPRFFSWVITPEFQYESLKKMSPCWRFRLGAKFRLMSRQAHREITGNKAPECAPARGTHGSRWSFLDWFCTGDAIRSAVARYTPMVRRTMTSRRPWALRPRRLR
jgi:hypothetical protein